MRQETYYFFRFLFSYFHTRLATLDFFLFFRLSSRLMKGTWVNPWFLWIVHQDEIYSTTTFLSKCMVLDACWWCFNTHGKGLKMLYSSVLLVSILARVFFVLKIDVTLTDCLLCKNDYLPFCLIYVICPDITSAHVY